MAEGTELRDDLKELVQRLVDQPDEVEVEEFRGPEEVLLELRVAEDDLGKVIGRQGRTARAIRNLLSAAGQKTRRRYSLDILD